MYIIIINAKVHVLSMFVNTQKGICIVKKIKYPKVYKILKGYK